MNLQLMENERRSLVAAIEEIPKRLAGAISQVEISKQQLADAAARIEDGKKERRSMESEIEAVKVGILKYRGQLLDVKTNKEYAALTKEIKESEEEILATEERILASMEAEEGIVLEKEKAGERLCAAEGALKVEKENAAEEEGRLKKELLDLDRQRESLRSGMEAALLSHFDKVFRVRGGVAVSKVEGGTCSGCLVRVRPQVLSELRDGQVRYCDSCNRILYFDRADDTTAG